MKRVRSKTLGIARLQENDQQWSAVLKRRYGFRADVDYFPITTCPIIFCSSWTTAICPQFQSLLVKHHHVILFDPFTVTFNDLKRLRKRKKSNQVTSCFHLPSRRYKRSFPHWAFSPSVLFKWTSQTAKLQFVLLTRSAKHSNLNRALILETPSTNVKQTPTYGICMDFLLILLTLELPWGHIWP